MTTSSISIDIFEAFGDTIDSFRTRQDKIIEAIWSYQIDNEGLETGEGTNIPYKQYCVFVSGRRTISKYAILVRCA